MKHPDTNQDSNKPMAACQMLTLTAFSIALYMMCLITPSFAQVIYCTGVPAPGNTLSSDATPCPGVNFTLSIQNIPIGIDITYQWQSADDLAFTVNVTNLGTASTQVTNEMAAHYYRCDVTCPDIPADTKSNPVYVPVAPYQTWYLDYDQDGRYSLSVSSCVRPGAGWSTSEGYPGDCDDSNPNVWQSYLAYIDQDNDGFDNGQATICMGYYILSGYWYTTNGHDCDDNSNVNPYQTEVCFNNIDDNCNGQIDENCCMYPTTLIATNVTSSSATLSWNAVESATKYKVEYKKATGNSSWTVKKISAGSSSTNVTGLLPSTKYKWKVLSICGPDQSVYSPVAKFNTKAAKGEGEISVPLVEQTQFSIYPNPATHTFIVDLDIKTALNGDANIQLLNELGQVVYAVNTEMSNGVIHLEVNPDENLVAGNYFVKVIADNNVYTEHLIIQR